MKWPAQLIPLELIGVITVDKHLCYIVKHQNHKDKTPDKLSSENCVVVRANIFRNIFPHIVIKFYETCVEWVSHDDSQENFDAKANQALQARKSRKSLKGDIEDLDVDYLDDNGVPIPMISIKKDEDLYGLPVDKNYGKDPTSSSDDDDDELFIPVPSKKKAV